MSLNLLVSAIAAAIAILGCLQFETGCDGKMVCAAVAVVASAWFNRRRRSALKCASTGALILSFSWLLRLVPQFPAGHQFACGSEMGQNMMSVPVLNWPLQGWLEAEHWMCDPAVEYLALLVCYGLCCGLASSQLFSAALEERRRRHRIRRSRPEAQHT